MRFMLNIRATDDTEAGKPPTKELIAAMGRYNEELVKAGILLSAAGLLPSAKGARLKFSGKDVTVIDGPFAETKELIAGFWIIDVKSKEEAIEWGRRVPNPHDEDWHLDIQQIAEFDDFGE
ncbi:YciI family protein [Amycolatopsis taiwanensis]|uniref:YCII-related domain-containing protein n=1 Tax=Amycolatopsis taiwanensis TaxID=342230 RepID=A0A9W6VJ91_9PSEU|nr:YciI family protein [Amycolatopsis taiwanensis]GLY69279.1 hypothetical protein Atai01_58980 [Amycolatopsis taiwanensis]